jgi:hypothetical protein
LPTFTSLRLEDLSIRALPHPTTPPDDGWLLERPRFDLVVRERGAPPRS